MVKIRDVKKLQQNIENDPIIRGEMADLGCFLLYPFGNFLLSVLVAPNAVNNLDRGNEVKGYESDKIRRTFVSSAYAELQGNTEILSFSEVAENDDYGKAS